MSGPAENVGSLPNLRSRSQAKEWITVPKITSYNMCTELSSICSNICDISMMKLGTSSIVIMLLKYIAKIKIVKFKITKMLIKKFTTIPFNNVRKF